MNKNIQRLIQIIILIFSLSFSLLNTVKAQLTVNPNQTATVLSNNIVGPGISILNPVLTCPGLANGLFTTATGTTLGTGGTVFGISSGIILCTGHASAAAGNETTLASSNNGAAGDATLASLALTATTYDACELQFDVVPKGDTIRFNYAFGSEEYNHSTCGPYDDAFAFFISGPGITGTANMALVPGTTIPVMVNTVNSGIPGPSGSCPLCSLSNCTSLGAGSPFTSYFVDNTGGTNFTYKGFTVKFAAVHAVTPCDTYHLKLAIVDAGNAIYDSGVFIEAGSLTTNSLHFDHNDSVGATINGIPHTIVKGCSNATVEIISTPASGSSHNIHLTYSTGTAIHGTDFTAPDSVTLPAGDTSVTFNVSGIPTPPGGTKTTTIYLSSSCGIADSMVIHIMDTPTVHILTPDTALCGTGASVLIRTSGSTGLTYSWAPSTGLSSTSVAQPTATPTVTTTYTLTASLPGSGCPPMIKTVTITVSNINIAMITPDTTICLGSSVNINLSGSATYTYNWTPSTGLSSSTLQDPIATPTTTTTFSVTATLPGSGCAAAVQHITITVVNVADSILTPDTSICAGSVLIRETGTPGLTYLWTPSTGLSSATVAQPTATPTVTTTYTVTASLPGSGCPPVTRSITITVGSIGISMITPDTAICIGNSVNILVGGSPTFTYLWTPATGLSSTTVQNPVATPTVTTTYTVTANLPGSGCGSDTKVITITVFTINDSILTQDTTICSGSSFIIRTVGTPGLTYYWTPSTSLSSATDAEPIASPTVTTSYVLTGSMPGCVSVIRNLNVSVVSTNISMLTANDTLCQAGTAVHLMVSGSTTYNYNWLPAVGLSSTTVQDPVATPTVTTTYTVTATLAGGLCPSEASVTIAILNIAPISMITPNTSICLGDTVNLQVNGSPTLIYNWTPATGLNNPNIQNPQAVTTVTTTYTVTASGTGGACASFAEVTITVNQVNATLLTHDTGICYGKSIQLDIAGDPSYTYNWSPADGLNNPHIMNPIATPAVTTTYSFSVSNSIAGGCAIYGGITIVVGEPIAPWLISPVLQYCQNMPADSLSADVHGYNLMWYTNYNDSVGSPIPPVPATDRIGTYMYYVSQNINYCGSTLSTIVVDIVMCCDGPIFIPTSFTPNSDGLNDYFTIKRPPHMAVDEFKIFNRWGNMVFSGNSSNDRWDGTYLGQPCETDTYFYIISLSCSDGGNLIWKKGDLTLIR